MFNIILFAAVAGLFIIVLFLLIIVLKEHRDFQEHMVNINFQEHGEKLKKTESYEKKEKTEPKLPEKKIKTSTKELPDENILNKQTGNKKEIDAIINKVYPPFSNQRLIDDIGLSEDEALEFTEELISQIQEQIPIIDEEIKNMDFYQAERTTHGLKGAALNVGAGGIADILVDYNTYLKNGKDIEVVKAYQTLLKHSLENLQKVAA